MPRKERVRRLRKEKPLSTSGYVSRAFGIAAADFALVVLIAIVTGGAGLILLLLISVWQLVYKISMMIVFAIRGQRDWLLSLLLSCGLVLLIHGLGCAVTVFSLER